MEQLIPTSGRQLPRDGTLRSTAFPVRGTTHNHSIHPQTGLAVAVRPFCNRTGDASSFPEESPIRLLTIQTLVLYKQFNQLFDLPRFKSGAS